MSFIEPNKMDIAKWTDYQKIEAFSNLINASNKKKLSNIDLTMVVKLPNSISFQNRILKLMKEPEKVSYKYRYKKKRLDNVTKFSKAFYRK